MKEQIQALEEAVKSSEGTFDVKVAFIMMLDILALMATKIDEIEKSQQRIQDGMRTIAGGGKIPTPMGGGGSGFSIG